MDTAVLQAMVPGELAVAVAGMEPVATLLVALVERPDAWVAVPAQLIADRTLLEPVVATVVVVVLPWTVDGVRLAVVPVVPTTAEPTR